MTATEVETRVRGIRHMKETGSKETVIHLLTIRLFADVLRVVMWREGTKATTKAICAAALELLSPTETGPH